MDNMVMPSEAGLDAVMSSVGLSGDLSEGAPEVRPEWRGSIPEEVQGRASLQMFWVVCQRVHDADRTYYNHIFSSPNTSTTDVAHDVIAWAAVVVARLVATGRTPDTGFLDPSRRTFNGYAGLVPQPVQPW